MSREKLDVIRVLVVDVLHAMVVTDHGTKHALNATGMAGTVILPVQYAVVQVVRIALSV